MKKLMVFLLTLMVSTTCLLAQTKSKQIKGKVTDESGVGLPHASVLLSGAKTGVRSDSLGNFIIRIPDDGKAHSIIVSYVGYAPQNVPASENGVNVRLERASKDASIDEVVVIGYQSVKRKDALAAISSVGAKQLKDIPSNSAAEALTGKLAGVQVSVSEGAPGADVDIYVRGRNSINVSGAPLYLVDGVQVENALSVMSPQDIESIDVLKDAAATAIYGARGSNGVILITTKGGKNTQGKTTVTYNGFGGFSKLSKELSMMDPYNFVLYQYERAKYTENATDTADAAQYVKRMSNYDTIASTYKNYVSPVDWQKATTRNAAFFTHNISVSGGSDKTQYNLSLTYNKQQGLLKNSDYDRKIVNFRFDHKASDRLKVGFDFRYTQQLIKGAGTSDVGGAGSNRLRQYTRYRPMLINGQAIDYYDSQLDANNPGNGLNLINPFQQMSAEWRQRPTIAYTISGYVNYNIAKNISFRSTAGYTVNDAQSKAFDDTLTANSRLYNRMPALTYSGNYLVTINNSNVLTFSNPSLHGGKSGLDILLGQEIYQNDTKINSYQINYFPVGTLPEIAYANLGLATPPTGFTQPKPASSEVKQTQLSFFGRINYNFNKKYMATVNFRADGSSVFAAGNQWGYFPSASLGWRFSEEDFMKNIKFISDAKLRLSYGASGNNRITPYSYATSYVVPANAGYGLNNSLNYTLTPTSRLANPDLTWETLKAKNLGVDLSLFKNKVNLSIDVYSNVTDNLLLDNKVPASIGYTLQYQNLGSTRNNGLEIQLGTTVMSRKDFNWNANFNIAFNKNIIRSLGAQKQFTSNSGWFSTSANPDDYLIRVGEQVGTMYGLKVDGFYKVSDFTATPYTGTYSTTYPNLGYQYTLDPKLPNPAAVITELVQPGSIKYRDINGDNKISLDSDRTIIGHALPKFIGGFNQQFTYKNFDMSLFINFSYGNDIYNANKLEYTTEYGVDNNMLSIMNGRWKVIDQSGNLVQKQPNATTVIGIAPDQLAALNANATIWAPARSTPGYYPSSFAIEDGSFIRINNVTIGYTFPKSLLERAKISNVRIYATANNLLTITKYSGYDPDVNARRSALTTPGVDYAAYPRGRTFIAGINVSF
jgi:TonB-linked SusC/RagA family outer membrane protein